MRFIGWTEKDNISVTTKEQNLKGRSFTLIPDRFGDIGNVEPVTPDVDQHIL